MFDTKNRGPALPVVDAGPYTQLNPNVLKLDT